MLTEPDEAPRDESGHPPADEERALLDRARLKVAQGTERARGSAAHHVSIAVPFRALERNRRVAASVLAGGLAYRLFLWLLPFGLILGGVLGLGDADRVADSVSSGGLPQAMVDAIGDVARAGQSNSWWLLAMGVPLLLWEGYTGAKALQLVHSLIWEVPPPRTRPLSSSLLFSASVCVFLIAVSLTWWLRDWTTAGQLVVLALMVLPLAALWLVVSLHLAHDRVSWTGLLPGALFVAGGFQFLHGMIVLLLGPKLEKSMSLYGGIGLVATVLFFMYMAGRIVVTAPILNSALSDELRRHRDRGGGSADATESATVTPPR